jgi:hypothetical protein
MSLSDDDVVALARKLVQSSYTSVRPPGMRGIRGSELLDLARERHGDVISEEKLDAAVARVGGHAVELTNTRDVLGSAFGRRKRWRRAYLLPASVFDGLEVPSRLRPPSPRADG